MQVCVNMDACVIDEGGRQCCFADDDSDAAAAAAAAVLLRLPIDTTDGLLVTPTVVPARGRGREKKRAKKAHAYLFYFYVSEQASKRLSGKREDPDIFRLEKRNPSYLTIVVN